MPFRKRKILKEILHEERQLAAELERCKDVPRPNQECDDAIRTRQSTIEALFHRLQVRRPLDWNEILVRLGAAMVLFFLLLVPTYPGVRAKYIFPSVVTKTSAIGETALKRILPIEPIRQDDWPTFRGDDRTDPVVVGASADLTGGVVGVVPEDNGAWVYWLEGPSEKTALKRRFVQRPLSPIKEASTVLPGPWTDGSLVASEQGIVFAGSRREFGRPVVAFFAVAPDGTAGEPSKVTLDQTDETAKGLQLFRWQQNFVLLTLRAPLAESAKDRREVILRLLSPDFRLLRTVPLTLEDFQVGYYPAFLENEDGGGFSLVFQGKLALKTSLQIQGDNLYRIPFDAEFNPLPGQRLTTTGLPHEFWPTALLRDGNRILMAMHQAPKPFTGDQNQDGYPENTGKLAVIAFDPNWKRVLGSAMVYDQGPFQAGEDFQGANHLRLARRSNILYVAYDRIVPEDPETTLPKHTVELMKILF